jgi:2-polyprenyl-6-methoxyphenol hydroxylase-like FAD-dependent oxidoreductase
VISGTGTAKVTTGMPPTGQARPADEADVVIVGGGPTGLMLAAELRLGGADPVVLERRPEISEIPKGNGLAGQIVPVLDYRGLLERFGAEATWAGPVPRFSFGPLQLDFSRLGVSPLHVLTIPQRRLEELLGERLTELGGTVRRGHELIALSRDDDAVTLEVRGPQGDYRLRARYLALARSCWPATPPTSSGWAGH